MSYCDCDYDVPTISRYNTPKANKEHECNDCRGIIRKGEKYHLFVSLNDGSWFKWKRCPDCDFAYHEVSRSIYADCNSWCYDGSIWGGIMHEWRESTGSDIDTMVRIVGMWNATMETRRGRKIDLTLEVHHTLR